MNTGNAIMLGSRTPTSSTEHSVEDLKVSSEDFSPFGKESLHMRQPVSNSWIWMCVLGLGTLAQSAQAGLVARYEFDGTVQDLSGNGHNAQLFGGATYVPGPSGSAIHFQNPVGNVLATQYVLLPNDPQIANLGNRTGTPGSGSFTVFMMVKSTDGGPGHNNGRLFGVLNTGGSGLIINYNEASSPGNSSSAYLYSNPGGSIGTNVHDPAAYITDGVWHCVALSVNRLTEEAKYYVDNELIQTLSLVGKGDYNLSNLTLGRNNGGNGNPTWTHFGARNTAVDDFRLYDTALTAEEIATICPEPSSFVLAAAGLVGCWMLRRRA
ncbi:MAG: LamG-like jellyroll fold domain-containing protein [Planctomycetaceae bacterium]